MGEGPEDQGQIRYLALLQPLSQTARLEVLLVGVRPVIRTTPTQKSFLACPLEASLLEAKILGWPTPGRSPDQLNPPRSLLQSFLSGNEHGMVEICLATGERNLTW